MRTADTRDILLYSQVQLRVSVKGIIRDIRYFIAPELVNYTSTREKEYLSLILGLSQLYSVNTLISIRQLKIIIGNTLIRELVIEVTGLEMVFYKDYNILIYPKSIIVVPYTRIEEIDNNASLDPSKSLDDNESKEELTNYKASKPKQSF